MRDKRYEIDVAEAARGRRATDVKDISLHAPAPACNLLS